jgi:hypothetical protein
MNMMFLVDYKDYDMREISVDGEDERGAEELVRAVLREDFPRTYSDNDEFALFLEDGKTEVTCEQAAVLGSIDEEIVKALLGDEDAETVVSIIEKRRYCEYRDGATYAEQWFDDIYGTQGIPDMLANHINWQEVFDREMRYDTAWVELTDDGTDGRIVVYDTDF